MSEPDGQHISGYDPALAEQLLIEAAGVVHALGFAAPHVVLIGGLVPGLLVPVLDPGLEPHVGSGDIDLCLSVALIEGDTATYERIETVLKRGGFVEGDASFQWRRGSGLPLTIEFFCPASEERPAGRMFRPAAAENPVGKHNLGGRLSAYSLDAGNLLTTDVEVIMRELPLPGNKGAARVELKVTGPLGFLVAKSQALIGPTSRDKPKDAYDIVWLIESWPGGRVPLRLHSRRGLYFNIPMSLPLSLPSLRRSKAPRRSARAAMRGSSPCRQRRKRCWSGGRSALSPPSWTVCDNSLRDRRHSRQPAHVAQRCLVALTSRRPRYKVPLTSDLERATGIEPA